MKGYIEKKKILLLSDLINWLIEISNTVETPAYKNKYWINMNIRWTSPTDT